MKTERQEEVIRSLDFTLTVSEAEATVREWAATKFEGISITRLEDEAPKGKVVINFVAENPQILSDYNQVVVPMLVESKIWKDSIILSKMYNERRRKI